MAIPYKEALELVALNDDNSWLECDLHGELVLSVGASFVAWCYRKEDAQFAKDLASTIKRLNI